MMKPTRRDLDRAVADSMELFSRARVSAVPAIEPRVPTHLLLAVDNSSQDATAMAMARQICDRFACQLTVVDAREKAESYELAGEVAKRLGGQTLPKMTGYSYEQILAAADHTACDLLIVPCPYGRDLESVGPSSAGTVIDVLLARSPVPLLVIRDPYEPEEGLFRKMFMVLTAENEAAPLAATSAIGLLGPKGTLELELVLEKEMHENIHALMQSIAPEVEVSEDSLSQALATAHMRLHRGLQKAATEFGFSYRLNLQLESESSSIEKDVRSLLVLALERSDHASLGSVQGRIQLSSHPVLVICCE